MKFRFAVVLSLVALFSAARSLPAHELRPGYLQLKQVAPESYEVFFKVPAKGGMRLSLDLKLPAHCRSQPKPVQLSDEAFLQSFTAQCPGGLIGKTIRVEGLSGTMTDVLARVERQDGSVQVSRLTPLENAFTVEPRASRLQIAKTYFALGVEHILLGIDHLLFLLALLLIVRGTKKLIATVTAFTLAHSLTLAAASLGVLRVPQAPVEAVIALSIAFVAAEIVHYRRGLPSLTAQKPWLIAFLFGLLHGLGFAGALREIGLPAGDIPLALLTFNLGVEAGQLAFIAAALLVVAGLRRLSRYFPPRLADVPPYLIGAVAMFWVVQRIAAFF